MTDPVTVHDILDKLEARFPLPEWATFGELRDLAGFSTNRTIDFFAFHTWPSKGHRRVAVEIKVSRHDFMREIEDPSKREPWIQRSNEFYFAVPTGLVKPDEVPEECGLFEVGKSMRRTKVAMQRKLVDDSISPSFVAVLLRNAARRERNANEALNQRMQRFAKFESQDISLDDLSTKAEEEAERWKSSIEYRAESAARAKIDDDTRKKLQALARYESLDAFFHRIFKAIGIDPDTQDKYERREGMSTATEIVEAAMRGARRAAGWFEEAKKSDE